MTNDPYGRIPPARPRQHPRVIILAALLAVIVLLGMADLAAYVITGLPILAVW